MNINAHIELADAAPIGNAARTHRFEKRRQS
jgi:hypothetical protein